MFFKTQDRTKSQYRDEKGVIQNDAQDCIHPKHAVFDRIGQGALAQLVERVVRNDEVSGSIPLGSTRLSI
jgi:hypothetical protein